MGNGANGRLIFDTFVKIKAKMAVLNRKEEKIQVVLGRLPKKYTNEEFVAMFIKLYGKDWGKIKSTYIKQSQDKEPGTVVNMPKPELYLKQILNLFLQQQSTPAVAETIVKAEKIAPKAEKVVEKPKVEVKVAEKKAVVAKPKAIAKKKEAVAPIEKLPTKKATVKKETSPKAKAVVVQKEKVEPIAKAASPKKVAVKKVTATKTAKKEPKI